MHREVAKFFAGVTAWEAVVHTSFAASGVLPLRLGRVTVTPRVNAVQIVLPAVASVALAYVGWGRQRRRTSTT